MQLPEGDIVAAVKAAVGDIGARVHTVHRPDHDPVLLILEQKFNKPSRLLLRLELSRLLGLARNLAPGPERKESEC